MIRRPPISTLFPYTTLFPSLEVEPLLAAEDDHGREGRLHQAVAGQSRELRSEEHTSELQSRQYLVCRLLLEKKKKRLGVNEFADILTQDVVHVNRLPPVLHY